MRRISKPTTAAGSMMMEFVIILPLFFLVLMGVAQFAHLWVGKHLTHYAAFSAARSALVHADFDVDTANRVDHDALPNRGELGHRGLENPFRGNTSDMPVNTARSEAEFAANHVATRICAWVSAAGSSDDGIESAWGNIRGSASMDRKVRANVQYDDWVMEVTVEHDFPLIFPIVGPCIGWLSNPFDPDNPWRARQQDDTDNVHGPRDSLNYPHLRLTETVRLPKPQQTVIPARNYNQ